MLLTPSRDADNSSDGPSRPRSLSLYPTHDDRCLRSNLEPRPPAARSATSCSTSVANVFEPIAAFTTSGIPHLPAFYDFSRRREFPTPVVTGIIFDNHVLRVKNGACASVPDSSAYCHDRPYRDDLHFSSNNRRQ